MIRLGDKIVPVYSNNSGKLEYIIQTFCVSLLPYNVEKKNKIDQLRQGNIFVIFIDLECQKSIIFLFELTHN